MLPFWGTKDAPILGHNDALPPATRSPPTMPKSKRAQKVTLSKTVRKGRERKEAIIEEVRDCVGRYKNVLVFETSNMPNTALKDVRARLRSSRIFFGRNKLIAAALGRTSSNAYRDGLDLVAEALLGGEAGIIFTDESLDAVQQALRESEVPEYARSGFEATEDVTLCEGELPQFAHSIEPYLRKLGMPTKLQAGTVVLLCDYHVCKAGDVINSDQAKILQLVDNKMAVFQATLTCHWSEGKFRPLSEE